MISALFVASEITYAEINIDKGIWIDVRTLEEFNSGNVKGAINIPHGEIGYRIKEATTDKNAEIHVYCRSGRRSGWAKDTLEGLGYTNVTNQGGYKDITKKLIAQSECKKVDGSC
ncbi:MAG: rhodanese-like domain-containing protein [Cellvibrionaceae bacterium]